MDRIRGLQDLKRLHLRGGEDKVYFEMYKLVSERHRLAKVRAALMSRIGLIDYRIGEITTALNLLEPKKRDWHIKHAGTNREVREGGEQHGTRLVERFWRYPGLDSESGSTER